MIDFDGFWISVPATMEVQAQTNQVKGTTGTKWHEAHAPSQRSEGNLSLQGDVQKLFFRGSGFSTVLAT